MTSFQKRFQSLDTWLKTHTQLWQFDTFARLDNPWKNTYPELSALLEQDSLEKENEIFYAEVFRLCPDLQSSLNFSKPDLLAQSPQRTLTNNVPNYVSAGIKGRKWSQIQAFVAHTPKANSYVEWCAGKGHLGKLLAFQDNKPIHSLEWQKTLCVVGEQEAKRLKLPQTFTHADVLKGEGRPALANAHCAVALHACGDLHRELIEQAVASNTAILCISPCCYHLTQANYYLPLSQTAQQSALTLRQADLKLAVKEVATAGAREQRLKKLELTYRLGFDAWQRIARRQDDYLQVPSIQKALLNQGFIAFCHWAAEQKSLTGLIAKTPFENFESVGEARYQQIQKLESISQLFRPALEYWLVLDRAMYLEENGYQVEIGKFCEKSLTPRNWMIRAVR
ncbi:Methyltransferase domain-containing protein [Marinomonas polaris DSM 16579]|uniref:Methyltransferase domain-containing protein n=1 Tax=Marinomonas polaris DSM 16579 TaxID=1122206 RepID=A0A1M5IQW0_9GAMM|nr:methyltransferase [Marinomonas polaris]SHG30712.1 Methyltransferase domain-containing protein [Marinomonas polaris DSM 16579]